MKQKIAIIFGSKNDIDKLDEVFKMFKKLKLPFSLDVISAHRHPDKLRDVCKGMEKDGVEVVIAGAGMAAALPGFVASYVDIPVIGVAMKGGLSDGLDALYSMVSIPKGIGLVSSGVGKAALINAMIVALEIISLKDKKSKTLLKKLKQQYK